MEVLCPCSFASGSRHRAGVVEGGEAEQRRETGGAEWTMNPSQSPDPIRKIRSCWTRILSCHVLSPSSAGYLRCGCNSVPNRATIEVLGNNT
jgi:hypothetical protein